MSQNQERLKAFLEILSYQAYPQLVHPEYATNFAGPYAKGISPNLPQLAEKAKNFGFFELVPDPDGTVRREPTMVTYEGNFYPSLDVASALAYTDNSLDQVQVIFNAAGAEKIVLGQRTIPTDRQGFVQLDYVGKGGTFPTYSFADVVQHRLSPDIFRDRLVLIGSTARGISGMALTPTDNTEFPGVEIHANMIYDILYQHFIRRCWREKLTDVAFIVLFSLVA